MRKEQGPRSRAMETAMMVSVETRFCAKIEMLGAVLSSTIVKTQ